MVLNSYRDRADRFFDPIARRFGRFHPNTLTMVSLAFAFLAGAMFYLSSPFFLVLGSFMVALNAFFDALDGKVARITARTSRRGDFLDHLVDRYADLAMLTGLALSSLCRDWLGFLALTGVFMTSYTGTQAQAVGLKRNYGGILGRADRMIFLMFVPIVQAIGSALGMAGVYGITFVEMMMIWFAVAGHITAIYRAKSTWRDLW